MKEITFNSLQELKERIKPALQSKKDELKRKSIQTISEEDLFNFYEEVYFEKGVDLNLFDMVEIILYTSVDEIVAYFVNKRQS